MRIHQIRARRHRPPRHEIQSVVSHDTFPLNIHSPLPVFSLWAARAAMVIAMAKERRILVKVLV